MTRAFPDAPIFTSLYEPLVVLPELATGLDVRPSPLNRVTRLRQNHRAAMPFLAATFNRINIDADVVLCSTSGWAHGVTTPGRKIAYCYNPARWIYQRQEYAPLRRPVWWAAALAIRPYLLRWDRKAAASCDRYIAISSIVAERIRRAYGRDAEVLPPPTTLDPSGEQRAIPDLEPGFFMSVNRLVAHKNTSDLIRAFASLPDLRLVIVGDGPEHQRLALALPRQRPPDRYRRRRPTALALRELHGAGLRLARGLRPHAARSRELRQALRPAPFRRLSRHHGRRRNGVLLR